MTIGYRFKRQCWLMAAWFFVLMTAAAAQAQTRPQITQPIDATQRQMLGHTVHPLANSANDRGRANSSLPMKSMILLLQPNQAQTASLKQAIDNLHNPTSPSFHKWLTPEQYAAQFGAADADVSAVSGWLTASGFTVEQAARGKNWIRFSGTASQVESAFRTEIHAYSVNGASHYANATGLSIPAALASAVTGVVSMNNFVKTPQHAPPSTIARNKSGKLIRVASATSTAPVSGPTLTTTGTQEENYLAPGDFATIYNTQPLIASGTNGTGVSIALVGRSDISMSDVEAFRTVSGLPFNDPTIVYANTDPGDVPGDDVEATLDAEWSGAVAPQAKIYLVLGAATSTTDGLDIAASYAVDNITAPILSVSFGECEANFSTAELAFYQQLWQQAAAEGITVFVAAGDAGSSTCNAPTNAFTGSGFGVNGLASSAYDVVVGGTEFNESNSNPNTYWRTTTGSGLGSALGYIPEAVWNESCNSDLTVSLTNCNFAPYNLSTYAGGGGASSCAYQSTDSSGNMTCTAGYAKPSWQTGAAVPNDGVRDLPDVALAAAAAHDGYIICFQGSCQWTTNSDGSVSLDSATVIGGTSAASPSMAGIMALVEQAHGPFQGVANYQFYKLAGAQSATGCNSSTETTPGTASTCVFNDITTGSNAVACSSGSPNCDTTPGLYNDAVKPEVGGGPIKSGPLFLDLDGYSAVQGYDQASGLGSVNAANLVSNWGIESTLPSAITLQLSQTTFQHGTSNTVTGQVTPASGTGTPSGDVLLTVSGGGTLASQPLTSGAYSTTTQNLPGGTYTLTAQYSGDATYSSSTSAPVSVTITPENSVATGTTFVQSIVEVQGKNPIVALQGTLFNMPFWIQVQINGVSGSTGATGSVTLLNGTTPLGTYPLSKFGQIYVQCGPGTQCDLPAGTYNFTAKYSGDASFNPTTTTIPPFTVSPGILYWETLVNNQTPAPGGQVVATVYFIDDPTSVPTGTVTLTRHDTGATLATGTIAPTGIATIPFIAPSGNYFVYASYTSTNSNYLSNAGGQLISQQIITTDQPNPNAANPAGNQAGTAATTLTLNSMPTNATLGQQTQFTVSVTPKPANANTPVGTVTFYSANGAISQPMDLSGGHATGFVQWTSAGTQQIYAAYSGDLHFAASNTPVATVTVAHAQPTVLVQPVANYVAVGGQASLSAVLTSALSSSNNIPAPTGSIQFYDSLNGAPKTAIGMAQGITGGNAGALIATLAPNLPQGSNVITAVYSGDANWNAAMSAPTAPINVTNPSFIATATTTQMAVTAGESASINVSTQSILGFSGQIALSCGGSLPVGITCTPSSVVAGGSGTINLSSVAPGTSPSSTASAHGANLLWPFSGAITVAGLFLIGIPRRRRFLGGALMLLMLGVMGGLAGCSGGTSMAPTTLVLTSANTKVASGGTVTLQASMEASNQLSGTVTFYDGTAAIGAPLTPVNGLVMLTTHTLAVGIHPITAKYSGDNENGPSTSAGVLEQAITGNFTVTVNAVSGTLNQTASIPASLQ